MISNQQTNVYDGLNTENTDRSILDCIIYSILICMLYTVTCVILEVVSQANILYSCKYINNFLLFQMHILF